MQSQADPRYPTLDAAAFVAIGGAACSSAPGLLGASIDHLRSDQLVQRQPMSP